MSHFVIYLFMNYSVCNFQCNNENFFVPWYLSPDACMSIIFILSDELVNVIRLITNMAHEMKKVFVNDFNNIFCAFSIKRRKLLWKSISQRKFSYTHNEHSLMVIVFLKYKRYVLFFRAACVTWCGFDSIKGKLEEGQKAL